MVSVPCLAIVQVPYHQVGVVMVSPVKPAQSDLPLPWLAGFWAIWGPLLLMPRGTHHKYSENWELLEGKQVLEEGKSEIKVLMTLPHLLFLLEHILPYPVRSTVQLQLVISVSHWPQPLVSIAERWEAASPTPSSFFLDGEASIIKYWNLIHCHLSSRLDNLQIIWS